MLAQAQRDLTAEQAADKLRRLADVHYKSAASPTPTPPPPPPATQPTADVQ